MHGFRSSFRDWAAEQTSYPTEMAEMALAHTVGDKVEAAYRARRHAGEAPPADGRLDCAIANGRLRNATMSFPFGSTLDGASRG